MAYVATIISTSLSNYDGGNELVGQIKNLIFNNAPSGVITVVSDNNPAPGSATARVVLLQVGNSQHYLRLAATTTPQVIGNFRNIANNNYLGSDVYFPNSSTVYLIVGANVLVLRNSSGIFVMYFKDSAGNWWGNASNSTFSFYPYNSDTPNSLTIGSIYPRLPDGRNALLPVMHPGNELYANCLFGYNNVESWGAGTIVQDGTGVYYMVVYSSNSVSIGSVTVYPSLLVQEG